jgi:dTDP-glucose 4,6-dehydratase
VADWPHNHWSYAIASVKLTADPCWKPRHSFEQGLEAMVRWRFEHLDWCERVREQLGYSCDRIGIQALAQAAAAG